MLSPVLPQILVNPFAHTPNHDKICVHDMRANFQEYVKRLR